ncbi:hypothetical protein [Geodermatophilus obscurus]|uniref:hypothetical protein n=1 Tax=Geodermatophilus obscurus TaxID=1861 RepID=UPI00019B8AE7|nr:hypothetical protein [Geodermatophilus obscurus]
MSNLVEALTYEPDEVVAVCHQDAQGGERGIFTHQHVPATADAIWDEASRWVDTSDLWWSINPLAVPEGYGGRGTAEHVTRFAAAYADLDVKPGGLPSMAAAWEVIDVVSALLGHEPVAVISSGHGLQPVWSIDPTDERTNLTADDKHRSDARALMRRFGRLVAHVAETVTEEHRGHVDSVFDQARVLRLPGSVNRKVPGAPVPTGVRFPGGSPLGVAELVDVLDAYGVLERPEDRDAPGVIRSEPGSWAWARTTCTWALSAVAGWRTDTPRANSAGRHPALVSKATRLAVMHRNGCLTEAAYREGVANLSSRFTELCEQGIGGEPRKVAPGEVSDALSWGRAKAATKTEAALQRELRSHRPHERPEAPTEAHTATAGESTALQAVLDHVQGWIDGDAGQFVFAAAIAVAAAETGFEPVWGDVVGPSSGGKTEAIRTLDRIATDTVDEITVAGLLSWQGSVQKGRPTGALVRIGSNPVAGLLTIRDLSTLLQTDSRSSGAEASGVFNALRVLFDGKYTREHGGAPVKLEWTGRLTVLAAVTDSIDNYASFGGQLGERFTYFRARGVPEHLRRSSWDRPATGRAELRAEAQELMTRAVTAARARLAGVTLSAELTHAVDAAASLLAVGRGKVPRDGYGRRDIIAEPEVEDPYRLRQQLLNLARALLALELTEAEATAFVYRVAVDTIPRTRAKVLSVLTTGGEQHSVKGVSAATGGVDRRVVRRVLEDLRALHLARCPSLDAHEDDGAETVLSVPRDWQLADNLHTAHARRIIPAQWPN